METAPLQLQGGLYLYHSPSMKAPSGKKYLSVCLWLHLKLKLEYALLEPRPGRSPLKAVMVFLTLAM